MSKEKQAIEEMAEALRDCHTEFECGVGEIYTDYDTTAQKMFAKGYRKASDVAREIFEEVDKTLRRNINPIAYEIMLKRDIAELKKKYTATDICVGCKETEDVE